MHIYYTPPEGTRPKKNDEGRYSAEAGVLGSKFPMIIIDVSANAVYPTNVLHSASSVQIFADVHRFRPRGGMEAGVLGSKFYKGVRQMVWGIKFLPDFYSEAGVFASKFL